MRARRADKVWSWVNGCRARNAAAFPIGLLVADRTADAAPLNYLLGHGDKAYPVVALTWGVLLVSVAVVAIIALLVIAAIWRRPGLAAQTPGTRLELSAPEGGLAWIWIGVGVSSVVLLVSVVWTMRVLAQVTSPPAPAPLTIEVTGRQWWWQIRYLSENPSRYSLPPMKFIFRPGSRCGSSCSAAMLFTPSGFPPSPERRIPFPDRQTRPGWKRESPAPIEDNARNIAAFNTQRWDLLWSHSRRTDFSPGTGITQVCRYLPAGQQAIAGEADFNMHCGSCHAVRGTAAGGILGPDLSHLMTRRTLGRGAAERLPVLARWISDPQGVKPGSLMQKPEISAGELSDIQAYLKTLN